MGAVFDRNTVSSKQRVTEALFTSSTEKPRPVSLATRLQVAGVLIGASLIDRWTAVTLGTKLKVNLVTNGIAPEIMPCGNNGRAVPTRWASKAFHMVLYREALTAASLKTVGPHGT